MNTNQGQQANATAERPQRTEGKLIDNRRNGDALLKLLMVHLLSVGGYALTAIGAWLILGLVAGTVVMVALGTRGKEGAQMGVLIAAGLVIAACCCTYSLMTDRFLRRQVGLATHGVINADRYSRRVQPRFGSLSGHIDHRMSNCVGWFRPCRSWAYGCSIYLCSAE